jgi:hypothetical protein
MRGQYFIALERSFQQCITRLNWNSFDPCSQGACGWESNLTPTPSFDHNSCKSSLNEQCEGTLNL